MSEDSSPKTPQTKSETTSQKEFPKTQKHSRLKNFLINTGLVIASSLFAVAIFVIAGEIWIRSQELPADTGSIYLKQEHKFPRVILKPGTQEIAGGAPVHINSLGFRGKEYSKEKPENAYRIIMLGDSFTFGAGAEEDVIFPTLVEEQLDEQFDQKTIQVLNLGVSDYNTEDELHRLKNLGLQLEPDVVLLFYVLNDIELKPEYVRTENPSQQANLSSSHSSNDQAKINERKFRDPLYDTVVALRDYSHFLAYMAPRIAALGRNVGMDLPSSGTQWSRDYARNVEGWQRSKRAILEMKALAERHNFHFAMFLFPLFTNLQHGYPALKSHEVIEQFAKENNILFYDLLNVYEGIEATSLWVSPTDGHPNAKGHKIAADAIIEFMTKHPRLLPGQLVN